MDTKRSDKNSNKDNKKTVTPKNNSLRSNDFVCNNSFKE